MTDYIIRATAANAQIRAFACTTRNLVEKARAAHNTSPVVSAALGRLMSGATMMGSMLKGDKDVLTLQIKGEGPIGGMTVTADSKGNVKGYAIHPQAMMPVNSQGKLDVGGVIGEGMLRVIKDMGLKEPYSGQTVLQTGEIAEDLTYYFATSEQVPSCVGLGVLMELNNTVKQAGGFIVQLLPFAEDWVIDQLEENIKNLESVTTLLDKGHTPEQILEILLNGMDIEFNDKMDTQFVCDCSKHKVEKVIISIGEKDINEMIQDGKPIEVNCQFCNKNYEFQTEELETLLKIAQTGA